MSARYRPPLRLPSMTAWASAPVPAIDPVDGAARDWIPAVDADGDLRDGAQICKITGLPPADGYPAGTRFIVRRERCTGRAN
jgi:hypothetical protein